MVAAATSAQKLVTAIARVARSYRTPVCHRALATHATAPTSTASLPSKIPSPSSWSPPIAPGICPAYDEALAFISSYQTDVKRKITELQSSPSSSAQSALLDTLVIASQIDDPKVRWAFENTAEDQLDLSDPTTRYLRERAWRKCGSLDKLIERIQDQGVIPDSVSHLTPIVDVQLILGSTAGPGVGDHTNRARPPAGDVLPGVLIEQKHVLAPSTFRLTSFAIEVKKHTLILLDLDVATTSAIETRALWAVSDIELSATRPRLLSRSNLLGGKEVLSYLAPHPARGTGKHRIASILFEQNESESSPNLSLRSLDVRNLVESHGLKPVGIHFYRSEWTETSSKTISSVWNSLGLDEEKWGRIPRQERKTRKTAALASWLSSGTAASRKEYEIKGLARSQSN